MNQSEKAQDGRVAIVAHLLGPPLVVRDGVVYAAPKGRKRELSVHAYLYRRDLGDDSAIEAARVLSTGVENPHLLELIDPDGPTLLDDMLGKVRRS